MTTNEAIQSMLENGVRQCIIVRELRVSRSRVSGVAYRLAHSGPGKRRAMSPPPEVVERIAREVAEYHGITLGDLLSPKPGRQHNRLVRARRAAWKRIMRETGCSGRGLAKVWGISFRTVNDGLKLSLGAYDAPTAARLNWQYGTARTTRIIAGKDEATNADLAAWHRVCSAAEVAA